MKDFLEKLERIIPRDEIEIQEDMSKHTTFRIGGPADVLIHPTREQLIAVIGLCDKEQIPYTVIGNGSNLLVSDRGIRGLVIEVGSSMGEVKTDGEQLYVESGCLLSSAAAEAARSSLTGMEFAHGIPGTMGGAVVMNAGAYGGEMKDIITTVEVLTCDGRVKELSVDELNLGYRHSCVPECGYIVLSAKLQLKKGVSEEIYGRMKELKDQRVTKQPLEFPSAGSTFKRPEGYFAGKLIQDCDLKGYTVGGAQVSEKHSGFVINCGNATAADVCGLIADVQKKVKDAYGIDLETEVKYVGDFE